jgi:hypothetical protein
MHSSHSSVEPTNGYISLRAESNKRNVRNGTRYIGRSDALVCDYNRSYITCCIGVQYFQAHAPGNLVYVGGQMLLVGGPATR